MSDSIAPTGLKPRLIEVLRRPIAGGAIGITGLRVVGLATGFATTFFLGRELGADGFGRYALTLSMGFAVFIPLRLGLDTLMVREFGRGDPVAAEGLARHGALQWLVLSLLACLSLFMWSFAQGNGYPSSHMFAGLSLGVLMALQAVAAGALRGKGQPVRASFPDLCALPVLLLLTAVGLFLLDRLNVDTAIIALVLCWCASTLMSVAQTLPALQRSDWSRSSVSRHVDWFGASLVILAACLMGMVLGRLEVLILSLSASPEAIGLFAMTCRLAMPAESPRMILRKASEHVFAGLHEKGDLPGIACRAQQFAMSETMVTCVIVFGTWVMALLAAPLLGEGYEKLPTLVAIVGAGYILKSIFGPGSLVLNMLRETQSLAVLTLGLVVFYAGLVFVLSSAHGAMGAAIAFGLMLIINGAAFSTLARLKCGLRTDAFGAGGH
ncbi:MAG: hypothetical protein AAF216_00080 [Pseudomonadota bacterium]